MNAAALTPPTSWAISSSTASTKPSTGLGCAEFLEKLYINENNQLSQGRTLLEEGAEATPMAGRLLGPLRPPRRRRAGSCELGDHGRAFRLRRYVEEDAGTSVAILSKPGPPFATDFWRSDTALLCDWSAVGTRHSSTRGASPQGQGCMCRH